MFNCKFREACRIGKTYYLLSITKRERKIQFTLPGNSDFFYISKRDDSTSLAVGRKKKGLGFSGIRWNSFHPDIAFYGILTAPYIIYTQCI